MESEKRNSPSFLLRLFLFLYFFFLVESALAIICLAWDWGFYALTSMHTFMSPWIYLVIVVLFACYAFHGITSAIRMQRYAIANLKISLLFYICLVWQSPVRTYETSQSLWAFACILFAVVFLAYLFFSKVQKRDFPNRVFSRWGWYGVGLSIFALAPTAWLMYDIIKTMRDSRPVEDVSQIQINEGEYCDGYSLFRLNPSWSIDSISSAEIPSGPTYFVQPGIIIQSSYVQEIAQNVCTAREGFNYITGILGEMADFKGKVEEVMSLDTILCNGELCISTYRLTKDSTDRYLTYAAIYPDDFYKTLLVCMKEDEIINGSKDSILLFMKSVDFNLNSRLTEKQ